MLAVADCRLPGDCRSSLRELGFEILPLPPFPALPAPVASHPDMLLFILGGMLLTHRDYYKIAKREIDQIKSAGRLELVLSDEPVGDKYPQDVLFNAAPVGRFVFGRADSLSRHISEIAVQTGAQIVDVRQGYTRCSTVIVGESAIITQDRGIAKCAQKCGIDLLLVRPGHVRLDGYDSGFIGGASGTCSDKVFFCGSLDTHPDGEPIRSFCSAHGKKAVSLGEGGLFDAGTLFFI
ncbi:MAG: hypothetical protein GX057_04960 [Clostridiales bacterium]|nr:hypothetical protein [Clostridiales bacterium]HOA85658.1 hypothetical protein [Bacillota bacterium]